MNVPRGRATNTRMILGRQAKASIGKERQTLNIIAAAIEERQSDPARQCTCAKGYEECLACRAWKEQE